MSDTAASTTADDSFVAQCKADHKIKLAATTALVDGRETGCLESRSACRGWCGLTTPRPGPRSGMRPRHDLTVAAHLGRRYAGIGSMPAWCARSGRHGTGSGFKPG